MRVDGLRAGDDLLPGVLRHGDHLVVGEEPGEQDHGRPEPLLVQARAGVVSDGLVECVMVDIATLQQSGIHKFVEGSNIAIGDGKGSFFGEAVGLGGEDGEGIQGSRCLRAKVVITDGDDGFQ